MPNKLHPDSYWAVPLVANGIMQSFWGAPTLLLLLKDRRGCMVPDLDLGIYGQNIVLAAHSHGIGSCWLGSIEALKFSPNWFAWKRRLGIRYPYELVMAIALGYPKGKPFGFVERETHQIDWFEGGKKRIMFYNDV